MPGQKQICLAQEVSAHLAVPGPAQRVLVFEADAGMGKTVIAAAAIAVLQKAGRVVVRALCLLCRARRSHVIMCSIMPQDAILSWACCPDLRAALCELACRCVLVKGAACKPSRDHSSFGLLMPAAKHCL